MAQVHEYSGSLVPASNSRWRIIRDTLNAVVLVAGAAYSLQYLFKYLNEIKVNKRGSLYIIFTILQEIYSPSPVRTSEKGENFG